MSRRGPGRPESNRSASADRRALHHPARVAILTLLARDGGRELSTEEIRAELSAVTATLTYHLGVLGRLNLIHGGGNQLYRLA